jgi:TRAP-type uncharacterized transport system fused permease subunit
MITPPVALASYAAAGLAKANAMRTGWIAFRMSFVLFLIPFAFAFDDALLWSGPLWWILLAFGSLIIGTVAWAVTLEGYLVRVISWAERALFGLASLAIIFAPTGTLWWCAGTALAVALGVWCCTFRSKLLSCAIQGR